MLARQILRPARYAALTLLLSTIPSCGDAPAADDNKREIDWRYGPTTGAARSEHLQGTGTKGGKPIAEGWKCHLVDGKKLTVTPYHLAKSNPLFGDTLMILGLFDKNSQRIGTLRSEAITAYNATFTFELSDDLAKQLYDLIIWFGKV